MHRFPPPRRMYSSLNIGIQPRYCPFRLVEDEDSSDTDTGKIRSLGTNISHFIINLTVNVYVFNLLAHSFRCDGRVRRNGSDSLRQFIPIYPGI